MKYKYLFLLLSGVFAHTCLAAQTKFDCDTVYDMAEAMPYFKDGIEATTDFTIRELAPVISECKKQGGEIDARLLFTLTINTQGTVTEVPVVKGIIPDKCKAELIKKLLTMTGWVPGQTNNQPVCCHVILPISIEMK